MAALADSLFEGGKQAHAKAQYKQAHDLFSKAIRSTATRPADRLKLLDHRIGTLLKLKKLDEALIDAKSMIRECRNDGRGYLRCGQLEGFKGDKETAIKWYEKGIKNVPHSSQLHVILTAKFNKTRDAIRREVDVANAKDPLMALPVEIVEMIIQYLEYRVLVISSGVSKLWREFLTTLPPLCDTLDFSGASQPVDDQQFRAALRRLKRYPRRAIICSLRDRASKLLPEHLERWYRKDSLEHLEVDDRCYILLDALKIVTPIAPNLRIVRIGRAATVSLCHVLAILTQFTQLSDARFDSIRPPESVLAPALTWPLGFDQPLLKRLEIHYDGSSSRVPISHDTFTCLRNLEVLRCSGLCAHGSLNEGLELSELPLRHLELSNSWFDKPPKMPQTLSELNLSKTGFPSLSLETIILPALQHLNLYDTISHTVFEQLLCSPSASSSLRTLHLNLDTSITCSVASLLDNLKQAGVKHLRLRSQQLGDDDTDSFLRKFSDLETLRLERACITGVFVAALVRRAENKLTYLRLEDCPDVSRDAVEFARTLGVTVEVKHTHDIQGGRRIM